MSTKTGRGEKAGKPEQRSRSLAANPSKRPTGKKGRKPIAPVKVGKDRNWGPIAMFVVVGVLAAGIIGYAFWAQRGTEATGWEEQAAAIEGIVNYRETQPDMLTNLHTEDPVQYQVLPPVGGDHSGVWQRCDGEVYGAPINDGNAVHSLEHGAVWITYNPDLLAEGQVDTLAGKVQGTGKLFLSPYPGLDAPISLQAWGYQLKVDDAGDPRIDDFIRALRVNASIEGMQATCSGGTNSTRGL